MNITSTIENSNHVIKWVDFSIAGGETVTFDNRNYLNYVTGHAASEIFGTLTGGGHIYIVNPNGILIGDGATVNVGNLHLSTRTLTDAQLAAFTPDGKSPLPGTIGGDVINLGTLNATSISVEGNVIKFKNVAEVEAESICVSAFSELHTGFEVGEKAHEINETEYVDFQPPSLPKWNFTNKDPHWYMLVRNEYELQNMRNNLNGNYMLAGDIEGGIFTTIGYSATTMQYKGRFDGMGYEISLRCIDANKYASGLFGAIGNTSVVENVAVKTAEIKTPTQARNGVAYIGGVVGHNCNGMIQNVYCTDDIISKAAGKKYIGGIVGFNEGGKIKYVYNAGDIVSTDGSDVFVGGIVGCNMSGGVIKCAYNIGTLQSELYAGGIVGYNRDGYIENVYNLASISGKKAGGIIGQNYGRPHETSISHAYHANGIITGSMKAGAIAGDYLGSAMSGIVSDKMASHVFYSLTTKDGKEMASDSYGIPLSVEKLQQAQTFLDNGWDISTTGGAGKTWRIYDGQSMPLLTAFLKPKDNIRVMEEDGTRPAGTYGLADAASVMVSAQLRGCEKGYNYVSDVVCIVPKEETTEPEPTDITPTPAITEPSEPTNPTNPSNPTPPTHLPETTQPSVIPNPATNPPDETNIPNRTTTEPSVITEPSGTETKEKGYDFDADYKQEMVVLHRPGADKPRVAADENEAKNLVIAGNGVRLPDAIMRVEEVEAMMAEAEAQDSRVAEDETDGSKQS